MPKKIHPNPDVTPQFEQIGRRLEEKGEAELFTLNGHTEVVIQTATAYQKLLQAAELGETLPVLLRSFEDVKHERTRPAMDVLREIAASVGATL